MNSWKHLGSLCTDGASSIRSLNSGFTALVNKRALQIISTPYVFHRDALANKALPEF